MRRQIFIAIEGVDGVGKTTVARLLAEQLQCEFVEKPFHLLLDTLPVADAYRMITEQVNSCPVKCTGMVLRNRFNVLERAVCWTKPHHGPIFVIQLCVEQRGRE